MELPEKIKNRITALEQDREHGSHHFILEVLDIIASAGEIHEGENSREMLKAMWLAGNRLIGIRPSMSAGIIHAVTKMWDSVLEVFLGNPAICPLKGWVKERRNQLVKQLEFEQTKVSGLVAEKIPDGATLMLVSYSSAVMKTIEKTVPRGIKVFVMESRPRREGVRTAEECAGLGIGTTLITDAQAGIFIRKCSMVLTGADAVLPSGAVVNKSGTSILACIAGKAGIPMNVIAHSWKIHPDDEIPLEEMEPDEIIEEEKPFQVRNIYFDITPREDITSIITEEGEIDTGRIRSLAEKTGKARRRFLSNPLDA